MKFLDTFVGDVYPIFLRGVGGVFLCGLEKDEKYIQIKLPKFPPSSPDR